MNTFNTKEDGTHLYRFYYVEPIIDIYAYDLEQAMERYLVYCQRMSCTDCTITRLTTRMICTATQTQQWRTLIVILRIYALTTYLLRKLRRALMPEVIRFREVGER